MNRPDKLQTKDKVRAWFELLRLPNLLTVPGDILAGFALALPATQGRPADLAAALLAGLFLYAAGLIMNDLADIEQDRAERPGRPLPSGRISRDAALMALRGLMGGALLVLGFRSLALLATGCAVGGLIFLYNFFARRHRFVGAAVMGLCRAGSLALGVVAARPGALLELDIVIVLAWWTAYIGAVSWLAARETEAGRYGLERWLPFIVLTVGTGWVWSRLGESSVTIQGRAGFAFMFAGLLVVHAAIRLGFSNRIKLASGKIKEVPAARIYPPAIGTMLSALIPLQAGLLIRFSSEPWILLAALTVLLGWPVHRLLVRMFPAS